MAKRQSKPNVVVFFTDQQRWDSLGVHGNPLGLTPNLDRVAHTGTHFANTFTCQPVCGPARSCLQTGQYATQTGVYRNELPLSTEATSVGKVFSAAGYHTGYIGKWHLGGVRLGHTDWKQDPVPEERRGGYNYWLAADANEFVSDAYHAVLFDNDNKPVELPGYRVDGQTDAAIRYMQAHKDDPFLLFLSFLEPHHQNHTDNYPAPRGYEEMYRGGWVPPDLAALGGSSQQHLAGYWGMVKRLDEAYGRMLDAIQSMGLTEDTIVLFISDHGNHFKTRNGEYKRSCHESSTRVPCVATGPGFDQGPTVQELISLVDIPATLIDAAGIEVPGTVSGRSAMPLVRRQAVDWPDDVFIQISEAQVGRAVRTHRWKYSVSAPGVDGIKHSAAKEYTEEFLYDLESDPYELHNLAGWDSHKEVSTMMRERLQRRLYEVEGVQPTIHPAECVKETAQRRIFEEDLQN